MFVVWSLSLFIYFVLFVQILRPPRSKCTDTRFPYTTPFRSPHQVEDGAFPYRPANGAEPPERGMMVLREQEADAEIGQRRFGCRGGAVQVQAERSEEHTSELQSLMRISYAVFCLKKKKSNHDRCKLYI